ncbi:peptide ligase PGM1-related protein [Streptomyces hirsutus]|uniref:preATP grasp domain-containing protein n=1 Tax=Streptomyces hirsutus TaxID=35620 RepID=UPI0036A678DC
MSKVVISNQRSEEMVGDLKILSPEYRTYVGNQAQRMAWSLQEGDVLVLPTRPDEYYLKYVTSMLGIDHSSIDVIVPSPGRYGAGVLSRDRLLDEEFLGNLRKAVRGRDVSEVFPFHFDSTVATLCNALGLADVVPGFAFLEQGGGRLLNSKATFRALAAGTGVALPLGKVCSSAAEAEEFIWGEILSRGQSAILKQDFHVAGFGNEVISSLPGVEPVGALRTVVTTDRRELTAYLRERWDWLTDSGRSPVVIERYITGSLPLCAEFRVTDAGVELTGHGAMRMSPVLNGHIWPASVAGTPVFDRLLESARRLCVTVRATGYRGIVSVDAILTPDREILINEFNCRVSGSTHAFHIGERIIGGAYLADRVLIEQRRCTFPHISVAVQKLVDSGLAYDHKNRTGVLIAVEDSSTGGSFGEYLIVAKDAGHAQRLERSVAGLFASHDEALPAGAA